jgi:CheY-like chemotaxis protein/anti-sigma regulatory factor (Ser/Thr protein kinase)
MAARRGIAISNEAPAGVYVFADRQRLSQILLNLLSNAVKYNRVAGTVSISARVEGDDVHIEVADTGAGIPPDKLALMFRPFERLGAEQSGIEGTGLGLALSQRLAVEMKGTLTVESQVDQGTRFRLRLSRFDGPADQDAAATHPVIAMATCTGSILYIEDNASNIVLMERLISRRPGVRMTHAQDGLTGLRMLKDDRPNLVILDLHLSDMSGEDVLREIWSDPATRSVPVAVLSADATSQSQRRLRAAGAMAYLTKPFDVAEILRLIDEVVGGIRTSEA